MALRMTITAQSSTQEKHTGLPLRESVLVERTDRPHDVQDPALLLMNHAEKQNGASRQNCDGCPENLFVG
jgi:hypothetical protein